MFVVRYCHQLQLSLLRQSAEGKESILIAALIPLLLYCLLQFTKNPQKFTCCFFYLTFTEYIMLLMYFAVVDRPVHDDQCIQTTFFWGYNNPPEGIYKDNIINIIVFLPVGILTSIIAKRLVVVKSLLVGMFLSETIECCQLIFKRGCFDVDDMVNNVSGALIGAFIYLIFINIRKFAKDRGCI